MYVMRDCVTVCLLNQFTQLSFIHQIPAFVHHVGLKQIIIDPVLKKELIKFTFAQQLDHIIVIY